MPPLEGTSELDRTQEFYDCIAIRLWQIIEILGGPEGIRVLAIGMPHDGFYLVAGACIVQTVFGS